MPAPHRPRASLVGAPLRAHRSEHAPPHPQAPPPSTKRTVLDRQSKSNSRCTSSSTEVSSAHTTMLEMSGSCWLVVGGMGAWVASAVEQGHVQVLLAVDGNAVLITTHSYCFGPCPAGRNPSHPPTFSPPARPCPASDPHTCPPNRPLTHLLATRLPLTCPPTLSPSSNFCRLMSWIQLGSFSSRMSGRAHRIGGAGRQALGGWLAVQKH